MSIYFNIPKIEWSDIKLNYFHIDDEESTNKVDTKPKNMGIKFKQEPTLAQLNSFLKRMPKYFYRIKGFRGINSITHLLKAVEKDFEMIYSLET